MFPEQENYVVYLERENQCIQNQRTGVSRTLKLEKLVYLELEKLVYIELEKLVYLELEKLVYLELETSKNWCIQNFKARKAGKFITVQ